MDMPVTAALGAMLPGGNEITEAAAVRLDRRTEALREANDRLEAKRVFNECVGCSDDDILLSPLQLGVAMERMGVVNPGQSALVRLCTELGNKANAARAKTKRDEDADEDQDGMPFSGLRSGDSGASGVSLGAWLEYVTAARSLALQTDIGRMVLEKTYRPPDRVDAMQARKFGRAVRRAARNGDVVLPPRLVRRLQDLESPGSRSEASAALRRGHLCLNGCGLRDVHAPVIGDALLAAPIA